MSVCETECFWGCKGEPVSATLSPTFFWLTHCCHSEGVDVATTTCVSDISTMSSIICTLTSLVKWRFMTPNSDSVRLSTHCTAHCCFDYGDLIFKEAKHFIYPWSLTRVTMLSTSMVMLVLYCHNSLFELWKCNIWWLAAIATSKTWHAWVWRLGIKQN